MGGDDERAAHWECRGELKRGGSVNVYIGSAGGGRSNPGSNLDSQFGSASMWVAFTGFSDGIVRDTSGWRRRGCGALRGNGATSHAQVTPPCPFA